MEKTLLHLLQRSFDEELEPAELIELEKALNDFPELVEEKKRLLALRKLMIDQEYAFSDYFAENVMNRIEINDQFEAEKSFMFAFTRVALPGLAAAIILLLFSILNNGVFSLESLMGVESLQTEYFSEILLFNY